MIASPRRWRPDVFQKAARINNTKLFFPLVQSLSASRNKNCGVRRKSLVSRADFSRPATDNEAKGAMKATTRVATSPGTKKPKPREQTRAPIRDCVSRSVRRYFKDLNGHQPQDLYKMVLNEMESPLLEVVMDRTGGNQTLASEILGINRGTLRKKLKQHKLL